MCQHDKEEPIIVKSNDTLEQIYSVTNFVPISLREIIRNIISLTSESLDFLRLSSSSWNIVVRRSHLGRRESPLHFHRRSYRWCR